MKKSGLYVLAVICFLLYSLLSFCCVLCVVLAACFPGQLDLGFVLGFGSVALLCVFFLHLTWRLAKPHVSRTFFIVVILAFPFVFTLIGAPNYLRARKRSAASRVLEELRLIDAAVDQYNLESKRTAPGTPGQPPPAASSK